jgi:hypothetical protein
MKKIIKLLDCKDLALTIAIEHNNRQPLGEHYFKKESIIKATDDLCKYDLRLDNTTGTMYDNRFGVLSKFVNPSEFIPFENIEDVCKWDFTRNILNEAGRIERSQNLNKTGL